MPNTPTNGADTFTFVTGDGGGTIDGLDGFDTINIDHSAETVNEGGEYNGAYSYYGVNSGYVNQSADAVSFRNIEALNLKLGSGNDGYSVFSVAAHATIDGGAGSDTFYADYSDGVAAIGLTVDPNGSGAITGTNTTFGHFEVAGVTTGSGNDTLVGAGGNDTFHGGAGNDSLVGNGGNDSLYSDGGAANTLLGGAGDDNLYSSGGADQVDGGADNDGWSGDYSGSSANLTFAQAAVGGGYTLTGGTTVTNVESVSLTTGSGNDAFTFKSGGGGVTLDGGAGTNTVTIDHSAETVNEGGEYNGAYSYYGVNSGYVNQSADAVSFRNIEALNLKLGSGNDGYTISSVAAHATVDGGAGSDTFYADYSDGVAAIGLTVDPNGSGAITGTNTTFGHFEVAGVTTGSGNDTLVGAGGNDTFHGGAGNDSLVGNGGNDSLYSDGGAANTLLGGAGDDNLYSSGGADQVDGGADNDGWSGDYSGSSANLTFAQAAVGGGYTLTGGTTVTNVESVSLTTGSGNDAFTFKSGGGGVTLDGGAGTNTVTIDHSAETVNEGGEYNGAYSYYGVNSGYVNQSADAVSFRNIEALNLKLGSGNDGYSVFSVAAHATIDGGAGPDTFYADYSDGVAAIGLTVDPNGSGAITGTNTTFGHFEVAGVTTGSGNDTLVGAGGNDTFHGGAGNDSLVGNGGNDSLYSDGGAANTLLGGAGDDNLYSSGGADQVDGGADNDGWSGDYSGSSANLTFAQAAVGGGYTLTGGTTVTNVESVSLTTGSGNDAFTFKSGGGGVTLDGGAGTNTVTIDHSAETVNEGGEYNGAYSYYGVNSGYVNQSADAVSFRNIEALNLKLGSGNDGYTISSVAAHATVDGGAGSDTFYADYSDGVAAIGLTVDPNGSGAITGTNTTFGHFEVAGVTTGSGNDTLVGAGGNDTFHGGAGNDSLVGNGGNDSLYSDGGAANTLLGGAGDDNLYSSGGADSVDGGADNDGWSGDYSGSSANLTFAQAAVGGGYTLTGGTTVTNVESVSLTTGSGNDAFTFKSGGGGVTLDGGAGTNTVTIDHSAETVNEGGEFGQQYSYYGVNSGYVNQSADPVSFRNVQFLNLKMGSGNDSFTLGQAGITVDAGAGNDTIYDASGGGQTLTGGSGDDTVRFYGTAANFTIAYDSQGRAVVTDIRPGAPAGAALLAGFEHAQFNDQTVNLLTNTPPVAHDDSGFTVAEDQTITITAASLLANDSDVNNDALTVTAVSSSYGMAALNAAGNVVFTPTANFSGSATLTYTINDGHPGGDASAQITVNVTPVNDAPVAAGDGTYAVVTGDTLTVVAASGQGLLANDSDVDGDALTAVLKTGPAHGSVTVGTDGGFVYTSTAGYSGADSFTYQAKDPSGALSAPATVTLSVAADHLPVAHNDGPFTLAEDGTLHTTAAALLANDTDADATDVLHVTGVSSAYGAATIDGSGNIAFTPNANANGALSFTYTVNDGHAGGTATGTVAVNVTPVNDAPTAANDGPFSIITGGVLTVSAATGVLANDSDVDGDALTAVLKTGPTHGALTLNPTGGFTYTPTSGYAGPDSFSYQAKDPLGVLSGVATVSLTVAANTPPVAHDDSGFTTAEDTQIVIAAASLLANDTDANGDTLHITGASSAYGAASVNASGNVVFTPSANFNGAATITYTVNDGHAGGDSSAVISLAVTPVNDAPVAAADGPYAATAGTALVVSAANGVLANDTDVDGDSLTAMLQAGVAHGALTLNGNGGFSYTAAAGYAGADSFTYLARDPSGAGSNVVTVALTVAASGPHVINGDGAANTLTGDDAGDQINGLGGDDTITGGAGADTIDGGAGFDSMAGGKGDDTYFISGGGDVVVEAAGGGVDTVYTTASWTVTPGSEIEKLVATGSGALYLTGNAHAMEIDGNAAVNKLNDGGGADTLAGGGGSDVYVVHNALTQVVEAPGAGYDSVQTDLSSYSLPANVESLTFIGSGNFSGFGNAQGDLIVGGAGDDYLDGGANTDGKADRLVGGAGDDIYVVHSAQDYVVELPGGGSDTVMTTANVGVAAPNVEALDFIGAGDFTGFANATGVSLSGGAGNDHLYGGAGADRLVGLGGSDVLTGKGGADTFVLGGGGGGAGGGVDRVTDFHTGEDHVAFGQIVTKVLFATDTFNSATAGGGPGADYLFYDQASGRLYDEGSTFAVSGGHPVGGTATLIATFDAHPPLSTADFIL